MRADACRRIELPFSTADFNARRSVEADGATYVFFSNFVPSGPGLVPFAGLERVAEENPGVIRIEPDAYCSRGVRQRDMVAVLVRSDKRLAYRREARGGLDVPVGYLVEDAPRDDR